MQAAIAFVKEEFKRPNFKKWTKCLPYLWACIQLGTGLGVTILMLNGWRS
jgi:hypothetical protein